eukprot:TRINITY_DN39200_c0_g1_i1.p1 TRINITY_DN39200_c0_g1~~TRINITY_DN39200_c0_g1_i1.p1  ORF type:complete len:171 (-),score=38.78 TRINITY_DN39200_c0_g1_i1:186-698(-)
MSSVIPTFGSDYSELSWSAHSTPAAEAVPFPSFAPAMTMQTRSSMASGGANSAHSSSSEYATTFATNTAANMPKLKVLRLWKAKVPELQALLQEAAAVIMGMPDGITTMTTTGRGLSPWSRSWLHAQGLRLAEVLRWFTKDFAMWETSAGLTVTYLQSYIKFAYVVSIKN